MIKTKPFQIKPNEFFKILLVKYLKKRWWSIPGILVLAILIKIQETQADIISIGDFLIIFCIIYPIIIVISYWRYTHSSQNRIFYMERYFELDEEKIIAFYDKDRTSEIRYSDIIKTDYISKYYLLYISKSQFVFIPANAFDSNSDKEWFENNVFNRFKKG